MKEEPTINYAFALKHYNQNGRGRSMKKFCEEEWYDYEKFMQYSRRGQKDYSVLKEADDRQSSGGFIPLVVDRMPEGGPGIRDVRVRFTNGMELSQCGATSASCSAGSGRCLDSGAMVTMSSEYSIYLYREKVDLRKGISGLSGIVRDEMRLNPNTAKSVYVFSGRNPRIKKILVREHNRYELTQIRLDNGRFFRPVMDESRRSGKISWSDLVLLTEASVSGNVRIKYID